MPEEVLKILLRAHRRMRSGYKLTEEQSMIMGTDFWALCLYPSPEAHVEALQKKNSTI